jgi:hypothetical protein
MKKFGLKEASRAAEFAVTTDQKKTVLAVVKMLDVPITLAKEATKNAKKLFKVTERLESKIDRLEAKTEGLQHTVDEAYNESHDTNAVATNWSKLI